MALKVYKIAYKHIVTKINLFLKLSKVSKIFTPSTYSTLLSTRWRVGL